MDRIYKILNYKTKNILNFGDENIYEYSKEVYSSNVAIVTQKTFIFDMSISDNLSLVDFNRQHQIEVCKRVGIHDYIMSLKDGYNAKLVSDAENISIGKKIIALARTLLSKSEILLFDEVTSSLDMNISKQLMKIADDIIVIDHGKLVGKDTHKELIEDNLYYQILQK